jgi:hypothetical protein
LAILHAPITKPVAGEKRLAQPLAYENAVILPDVAVILPVNTTSFDAGPQIGKIAVANPDDDGIAKEIGMKTRYEMMIKA